MTSWDIPGLSKLGFWLPGALQGWILAFWDTPGLDSRFSRLPSMDSGCLGPSRDGFWLPGVSKAGFWAPKVFLAGMLGSDSNLLRYAALDSGVMGASKAGFWSR